MTGAKNKLRLTEKNSNHWTICSQKARHQELEKRLCNYVNDKGQYGCAVTSEMCQLKALAITEELGITGFKATLCLCQVAAGERVPTWQLISRTVLLETLNNFRDRLIHCLALNGGHFEHLVA